MKLSGELLRSVAPESPGSLYVNHQGCPAGEDTKGRLGVTLKENGWILGHCFHCGLSGNAKARRYAHSERTTVAPTKSQNPPEHVLAWSEWSPAARGWLTQYGITEEITQANGIGYVPKNGRVYIPVRYDGELYGWQMRAVEAGAQPKYLGGNYQGRRMKDVGYWQAHPPAYLPHMAVIVEDMLSALKVGQRCSTVALLGTTITPGILETITRYYNKVYVWMDPDPPGQIAARKLMDELVMFVDPVLVTAPMQPKEATMVEIEEYIGR